MPGRPTDLEMVRRSDTSAGSHTPEGSRTKRCVPWPLSMDGVGVVAALALDAPDAGEAVELPRVVEAARGVAEDARAELLHAPKREAPALDGGGGAAEASGAVAERAGGEVGGAALDLVEVDARAVPDDVRDVIGVEMCMVKRAPLFSLRSLGMVSVNRQLPLCVSSARSTYISALPF